MANLRRLMIVSLRFIRQVFHGQRFFEFACFWISSASLAAPLDPALELPFKAIHFEVRDLKSGKELSRGTETISRQGDQLSKETVYWLWSNPNTIIQKEVATFSLTNLRPQAYRFENFQSGESVSLTSDASNSKNILILYRPTKGAKEEATKIEWSDSLVIGKTLHHVIVRAWEALSKGEPKAFPLFVPMKRDQYNFRVISRPKSKSHDGWTAISLELDQWALRQLAPSMLFMYKEVEGVPRLERYEGPTTVNIDGDADRKVIIDFRYQS